MAPATIDYKAFDVTSPVTLLGGSGGNTFNVTATTNISLSINPGTGTDNVTLNNTSSPTIIQASTGFDNVAVNPGNLTSAAAIFPTSIDLNSLSVGNGGSVMVPQGANKVLYTHTLSTNGTASIDLSDNAAIVDYTGATPVATVRAMLTSGYNAGNWTGAGLNSSTAAGNVGHHTALGYAEANEIGSPATFRGHSIDATSVLVAYAYYGDANLDKEVDLTDFTFLAGNFNGSGKAWDRGNFNYDAAGLVDLTDFTLLASNFNQALPDGGAAPATGTTRANRPNKIGERSTVVDQVIATPVVKGD